ncbi:unnamed protein product [Kuraishia capsulata CBS 1993]|uniref:C2H2-type domain-containing protein n=1 Tax=Kuraishia capsulata CBS 1993 TaxID=1382522 RepID=W6MTC3_9ASCO|nr:uncharacterized protein KUCA_T00005661001 [Kuraishia capsulata CBS 1993]CDK29668.1 unnamed protein product [Kuraishia capsulata CBS 1993]
MLDMYNNQKSEWDMVAPVQGYSKDDPFHDASYSQMTSSNFKLSLPDVSSHQYSYPPPIPDPNYQDDLDGLFMDAAALQSLDISLGKTEPDGNEGNFYAMYGSSSQDPSMKKRFVKTHNKRQSGSAIFGFVGSGHKAKLSISGIPEISASDIKYGHGRYGSYDYTGLSSYMQAAQQPIRSVHPTPHTSPVRRPNSQYEGDFIVTANAAENYKFPREPSLPVEPQLPVLNHYSADYLKNLSKMLKNQDEADLSLTEQYLNLEQNEQHKPETNPFFFEESPLHSTYKEPQPLAPSKFYNEPPPLEEQSEKKPDLRFDAVPQLAYTPESPSEKSRSSSPERASSLEFETPSKKSPVDAEGIVWTPVLVTKKDTKTEKIIKAQQSPARRESTIKTTLPRGHLDQHFVGPDKDNKFKCIFNDCGKLFGRISNIRTHIQTHLCDRPFSCQDCGKSFVRHHDLKRHRKGHEEFKFACPCGKLFPRPDALKRHRSRMICSGGLADENHKVSKQSKAPKSSTLSTGTLSKVQLKQIEQNVARTQEQKSPKKLNSSSSGFSEGHTSDESVEPSSRLYSISDGKTDADDSEFSFSAFDDFKASAEGFISVS